MEDGEIIVEVAGVQLRVDWGLTHSQSGPPAPHLDSQPRGRTGWEAGGRREDGAVAQDGSATVMRVCPGVQQADWREFRNQFSLKPPTFQREF